MMCEPELREAWNRIVALYEKDRPNRSLIVTCTYRSVAEQVALYAQGRTTPGGVVTEIDGITKLSNHNYNPARALDFAVLVGGKISWDHTEYSPVGALGEDAGLVWGGSWHSIKDYPHLELKEMA